MPSKEGLLGSLIGVFVSRLKRIAGILGGTSIDDSKELCGKTNLVKK